MIGLGLGSDLVLANGNFYAKQGLHGGWVTMAGGGRATHIGITTIS